MTAPLVALALAFAVAAPTARADEIASGDLTEEVGFGNYRDQETVRVQFLVLDPEANRAVATVGRRVVEAAGLDASLFTFRILNMPTANAWATSGRFVYVTSGLLELVDNRDELAAVLSHEVVHLSKNHLIDHLYRERRAEQWIMAGRILLTTAVIAGGVTAGQHSGTYFNPAGLANAGWAIGGFVGFSIANVMLTGYKVDDENEADRVAVATMVDAGYDPYAIIRVFKKLAGERDRFSLEHRVYASALVNKRPGLEQRIEMVAGEIDRRPTEAK